MRVQRENIPGVTITLDVRDARELAHILDMHAIHLRSGEGGRGTSIDDQIAHCETWSEAIKVRVES